jgi:ABC-type Zn2+ transport system substrate-binding protein/surface adhesin
MKLTVKDIRTISVEYLSTIEYDLTIIKEHIVSSVAELWFYGKSIAIIIDKVLEVCEPEDKLDICDNLEKVEDMLESVASAIQDHRVFDVGRMKEFTNTLKDINEYFENYYSTHRPTLPNAGIGIR